MDILLTEDEIMNERWVDFEWNHVKYQISDMGRIMSYVGTAPKLMKLQKNQYGEIQVVLADHKSGTTKNILVGKEVARHFVENPNNYEHIRYKDGNQQNCRASNIEWSYRTDKMTAQYKAMTKRVNIYNECGSYCGTFDSPQEAASVLKLKPGRICRFSTGKLRYLNGYLFRYEELVPAGKDIQPPKKLSEEIPVSQYLRVEDNDHFTDKPIRRYRSAKEAEQILGIKGLAGNIKKCIRGERASAAGYIWK